MGSTGSQDPGLGQGPYLNPLSTPQTDYFHLFICVAIVAIYGDDVIEQQLATDQMLLHFGNLAMHMNGELVLRKVSVAPSSRSAALPSLIQNPTSTSRAPPLQGPLQAPPPTFADSCPHAEPRPNSPSWELPTKVSMYGICSGHPSG